MILGLMCASALADEPPPPAPPPTETSQSSVFDPSKERYLERDRRARGAYRVAATVGAVGVIIELVGAAANVREVYTLGGTMEAVAIPTMAFSSLASAHALDKFTDTPFPFFAYTASGAAALDLTVSLVAAPEMTELTQQERRSLAGVALASRIVTLTAAVLQQRNNNRVRKRLGLRVERRTPPLPGRTRRPSVAFSPWLGNRSAGILLSLSDPGGRRLEQPRWTSNP
ncbi:MAG: hypothetical protein AAF602_25495 [Myxococcota bacterium]